MQRFFESVLEPVFKLEGIKTIVEIGADRGYNTAKLIQYANKYNGKIYSIDPVPGFDSDTWEKENPESFIMIKDLSLNAIKDIKDADCFLIDGDHNWYTVYHELKMIYDTYGEEKFPLIFFHDILWPYDRRDLYYSPDNIPAIYRNDYEQKAMKPGSDELCEDGINRFLCNAKKYGGEKNGVLTAVEDFIRDYPGLGLEFMAHDVLFGLGMIASAKKYSNAIKHFYSPDTLKAMMKVCESERLDKAVQIMTLIKKLNNYTKAEKRNQIAKFYPDFGEGYSEATAVTLGEYNAESGYYYGKVVFDKPPVSLRFDPVNDSYCIVDSVSVIASGDKLELEKTNGTQVNNGYIFTTGDPQLIFRNKNNSREFKVSAYICPVKSIVALDMVKGLLSDKNMLLEDKKKLILDVETLNKDMNKLTSEKKMLTDDRNTLAAKNEELEQKNKELADNNRKLVSDNDSISLINSKVVTERDNISADRDKKIKEISVLNAAINKLKVQLENVTNKSSALTEELKKTKKAIADSKEVVLCDKKIAQKLTNLNKKIGWKYALKSLFTHGLFATRTNIKAIKEIRKNGGFDVLYYCAKYKDVLAKGIDPLLHFIWFGGYEGRNPSTEFESKKYLAKYNDVRKRKVNPFSHYVVYGKTEKRSTFVSDNKNKVNTTRNDKAEGVVKKREIAIPLEASLKNKTAADEIKNTNVSGGIDVPFFSSDELIETYREFYNYSAQSPMLYPQKELIDKKVSIFMENAKHTMIEIYRNIEQDIKVSIIMPTYNRFDVISNAIESVIQQSYRNWELLIIDDGSEDDTESLVRKYCEKDSRIKFLKNNRKKGVCGARNTGLLASTGEYIAYLDTDNDWDSDYLLLMTNTLKINPSYMAIYCAQKIYRPEDNEMKFQSIRFGAYNHSLIKNKNYIDMNCYMHQKKCYDILGGFSEELVRFVDWELIHRYSGVNMPYALPCCLSNYYFEKADNQITERSVESYRVNIAKFDNAIKGPNLELTTAVNLDINDYEFYSDAIEKYACGKRNVSIIIPSYEALSCLITCIEAIKKFTSEMNYEIIIVDNNSSDIVKEYLKLIDEHDEKIKVCLNDHNMGFTYAVNQGIDMAMKDSDIILLNNDAIVTEGWIEELYRVKDNVGAGIIVPRQVLIPETKTMTIHIPNASQRRELDVSVSKHHHNVRDLNKYHSFGFTSMTFAPFFLVMITRECFNVLGYLDEKNGRHYKSDRLYCEKALENNIDIVYTPFSKAYHLLQQSTVALKESDVQMYKTIFVKNDWSDIGYKSSR